MDLKSDKIAASVMTTEEPFKLFKNGIYFRDKNGFGMTVTGCGDVETLHAILTLANKAYKQGYADAGSYLMPKVMSMILTTVPKKQ